MHEIRDSLSTQFLLFCNWLDCISTSEQIVTLTFVQSLSKSEQFDQEEMK